MGGNECEALQETLANQRLMTSTRFIMLPLFATGSAVLAERYSENLRAAHAYERYTSARNACAEKCAASISMPTLAERLDADLKAPLAGAQYLPWAGLVLALFFLVAEINLSRNIRCLGNVIVRQPAPWWYPAANRYLPRDAVHGHRASSTLSARESSARCAGCARALFWLTSLVFILPYAAAAGYWLLALCASQGWALLGGGALAALGILAAESIACRELPEAGPESRGEPPRRPEQKSPPPDESQFVPHDSERAVADGYERAQQPGRAASQGG